jgi:hypothetical protein
MVDLRGAFGPVRPARWLTGARLAALPDTLVFHARDKLAAGLGKGYFRLLEALAAHAGAAGWGVEIVEFSPKGQDLAVGCPRHLHVFMDDRPVYAANAVHAVPTYLHGFWYFDEIGSRNNSLQRLRRFDPRPMSADWAREFHAKLVRTFVDANLTKFPQADRGAEAVEPGCLAFFAQDFKPPRYHRHHMGVCEMIDAALAVRGRRALYIKLHPNQTLEETEVLARYHDPAAGVHVTQASIHDLLAAADCVLTVTSAAGFEAFLHRKPVVLGGQTDFWQNAITLTDPARMGDAIAAAMGRVWPHEKFLVWFLRQNCLEDSPASLPQVLDRLARKGFFAPPQGFF